MRHDVELSDGAEPNRVAYQWRLNNQWEGVSATFSGTSMIPADEAEETFITEHYWGYAQQASDATVEYQVEHPRWRVWRADSASLECDASSLYGPEFREVLADSPSTAFIADGSPIIVRRGRLLK